jgi:FMN phosphatase YigB (HAD superfamily)
MNTDLFAGTKVIVFDLDGTLYADTHHFDHYAQITRDQLPPEKQAAFWRDYVAIREGEHPLKLGNFYDTTTDRILVQQSGKVIAARTWDGEALPDDVVVNDYPHALVADHARIMNVGDLWWVVGATGAHHGLPTDVLGKCFLKTREWMMSDAYTLDPIPGLAPLLQRLKGKVTLVLATNSPQPDSEIILAKAGLTGVFDRCIFRTNKPAGFLPAMERLCADFGAQPHEILSVGDNLANEILPARQQGMRTAFIDPHNLGDDYDADVRVARMEDLYPYFEYLLGA